jgi:hypothetical protein
VVIVLVGAGADEADLVHHLRHVRQQLADLQPRHARGDAAVFAADLLHRVRLEIEGVVVRDPATKKDEDHRLRAAPRCFTGDAFSSESRLERERPIGVSAPMRRKSRRETPLQSRERVEPGDTSSMAWRV